MKTILSLRRHHYLKTVGILLIAAVLIAGVLSCNGAAVQYDLTIDSTAGGSTTPSEGTHTYDARTVVDLVAAPDCGNVFDKWTGDTVNIDDVNAAATNITMEADYSITANFKPAPIDHFKVYQYDYFIPPYIGEDVYLEDQFGALNATVGYAGYFANPVEKVHDEVPTPISYPDHHFMVYELGYEGEPQTWQVTVSNQFGDNQELIVSGPVALAVPTKKAGHEMPVCLDHYLLYKVVESTYVGEINVSLKDQFINEPAVYEVYEPYYFGNPVRKTHGDQVTEIVNPDVHAVIYDVWSEGEYFETTVQVDNQFGQLDFNIYQDEYAMLAVPSQKISWEQPLNHFKSYWVDEGVPPIGEVVQLEDQFVTITANVTWPWFFANPVEKWHGVEFSELSRIWDPRDHLMFYGIDILDGEEQEWEVVVDNQFGTGQWLRVAGPIAVIVPTEKIPHGPPEDLNHFLVYEVVDWELTPYEEVLLWDQFTPEGPEFNTVESPQFFAVPAHKTVLGGAPTPIIGDEHLLFYYIGGGLGSWEPIVHNQFFGPGPIPVYQGDGDWFPPFDFLGVPSQKISWNPWESL